MRKQHCGRKCHCGRKQRRGWMQRCGRKQWSGRKWWCGSPAAPVFRARHFTLSAGFCVRYFPGPSLGQSLGCSIHQTTSFLVQPGLHIGRIPFSHSSTSISSNGYWKQSLGYMPFYPHLTDIGIQEYLVCNRLDVHCKSLPTEIVYSIQEILISYSILGACLWHHVYRITWFGSKGTFKDHLVQPLCHGRGHFSLNQVAQSPIQPDLECFQKQGIYHLSGQLVPASHHLHHKKFHSYVQFNYNISV